MDSGKPVQAQFAFPGQGNKDTPAVGGINSAAQKLQFHHPVHKLDRGVVPDEKKLRQITH